MNALLLVSWVALAQMPDTVEARESEGQIRALAVGGWLYDTRGGELILAGTAGGPTTAFAVCTGRSIVVGPKGNAAVLIEGGERVAIPTGISTTLWSVDANGCGDVVTVGDDGVVLQGSIDGSSPRLERAKVDGAPRLPLYGVSVRSRAVAVGAGGVALFRERKDEAWKRINSDTEAAFLSVAWVNERELVVAGAEGLWRGDKRGLSFVHHAPGEVYVRVLFLSSRVGVALGQSQVAITFNGGLSWITRPEKGWLAVAPYSADTVLLLGRQGATRVLSLREEPPAAPMARVQRITPEPARPTLRPAKPASVPETPLHPSLPDSNAEPERDWSPCTSRGSRDPTPGFVDIQKTPTGLIVAGADGTVRRFEQGRLEVVTHTGGSMLGVAVSKSGQRVAVVGSRKVALSSDGGRTFEVSDSPSPATYFAAAYRDEELFIFGADGTAHRRGRTAAEWRPVELPPSGTVYTAHFATERRGYAVGRCGTLLATDDGGTTWHRLRSPVREPQGVITVGSSLFVSGIDVDGVYRSDDAGRTFRQILAAQSCIRLASDGRRLAAACSDIDKPLWLSDDAFKRPLERIATDQVVYILLSVAFDASGELFAVGGSDILIRVNGRSGTVTFDSPITREGLARALWLYNELRKEQRSKPETRVALPSRHP